MIENFVNEMLTGLVILFALGFGVIYAIGMLLALIARHCYRDYKKQGGAKVVIPKVVGGTAAKMAGQALRKRLFG